MISRFGEVLCCEVLLKLGKFRFCNTAYFLSYVLICRTSPGTLARQLIENGGKLPLNLEIRRRVRLEGAELEEYQRKERENKEKSQEKK